MTFKALKTLYILLFICCFTPNLQAQFFLKPLIKFAINNKTKYHTYTTSYTKEDRTIMIVPMIHLNKPNFFEKRKHLLDSLKSEGYIVFYEGVNDKNTTEEEKDIIYRKFRKLTHHNFMSYKDENNKNDKVLNIKGYVFQNDVNHGVDPKTDINCDLSVKGMIEMYEEKHGDVVLSECDLQTPMTDKYKCSKKDKNIYNLLVLNFRNAHLFKTVNESDIKKIAVVYGEAHKYALSRNLEDSGWKYVHTKNIYKKN